jgi:hypothetical protein
MKAFVDPPKTLPTIETKLKWTLEADSHWNKGTLNWCVADSVVNVTDDSGKRLGHVQACFGGFLEVHIEDSNGGFQVVET